MPVQPPLDPGDVQDATREDSFFQEYDHYGLAPDVAGAPNITSFEGYLGTRSAPGFLASVVLVGFHLGSPVV